MKTEELDNLKNILDECQTLNSFAEPLAGADEEMELDFALSKLALVNEQCSRIRLLIERFSRG